MPQNNKIKIRRGLNAALPAANTEVGELRYSTDSKELFIDDGSTNVKIGGNPADFPISTATKSYVDAADAAHVAATDPHTQYMNSDRGDARYAGKPYAVMAKSQSASLPSSYGTLGRVFGNDGYKNDLQVYGLSTQAGTPTPDVPVPIVNTTGNVTVRSDSKNLAYSNRVVGTPYSINGITYVLNADGTITANGTATANSIFQLDSVGARNIRIVAGTTYTVSGLPSAGSATTFYAEMEVVNDDATINYYGTFLQAGNVHTPAKNGQARVYVTVRNGMTVSNLVFRPQLEVSPTATTFEKNTTSTQTLPLGTTQLRSLPNGVSDRIYKDGSTWKLEQNVGGQTFNGSEAWLAAGGNATHYRWYYVHPTAKSNSDVLSDRFVARNGIFASDTTEGVSWKTNLNYVYIMLALTRTSGATTAQAIKDWLAVNPTNVIFELATPVTTTITDPTLITALENIRTYQGVTNITASTPVRGSYGLDLTTSLANKANVADTVTLTGTQTVTNKTMTDPVINNARPTTNVGSDVGTSALYYNNLFARRHYLNSTAYLDGGTAGVIAGTGIITADNLKRGTGFPNGVVTANVGTIYIDTAVTNGASSWIKKSGTGNTGWTVFEGDTGWRDISGQINTAAFNVSNTDTSFIRIRRLNNTVHVFGRVDTVVSTTTSPHQMFTGLTSLSGFRVNANYPPIIGLNASNAWSPVTNVVGRSAIGVLSYEFAQFASGLNISISQTYTITEAWPTTLPGTAV